jgi:hypothetical protein
LIPKINQDFGHYYIDLEDVVVIVGRIMITSQLELATGSIEIEGAVELT